MSPRKGTDGRVPRWAYRSYKPRVKKLIYGPYDCPKCGKNSLVINADKRQNKVFVKCNCGFSKILPYYPAFQPVDYYNKVTDEFYSKR